MAESADREERHVAKNVRDAARLGSTVRCGVLKANRVFGVRLRNSDDARCARTARTRELRGKNCQKWQK